MNKRIIAALLMGAILVSAVSCGKTEPETKETETAETNAPEKAETVLDETEGAETNAAAAEQTGFNYMGTDLAPYITVGNYKGLNVTKESDVLTEEEYKDEVAAIMGSYSYNEEITDRAVEEGDTVVTSYTGYIDGVAFKGGTSESSEVTAKDGMGYIEGFGPAFVGQMPGVEFSFKVTFPSVYGNLDLAGKEATFVCTISHIKGDTVITPDLTDEFVRKEFGYETVADFEKNIREYLQMQKTYAVENAANEALWAQVVEASTVLGYPDGEIARYQEIVVSDVKQTAMMYGVEYADFITNYLGMTEEQLAVVADEQAKKYVKENLIIYQIAKEQGILVTEDQFNEEVNNVAEMNGVTAEVILSYYGRDSIMLSMIQQRVFASIASFANITAATETTAE